MGFRHTEQRIVASTSSSRGPLSARTEGQCLAHCVAWANTTQEPKSSELVECSQPAQISGAPSQFPTKRGRNPRRTAECHPEESVTKCRRAEKHYASTR